MNKIKQYNLGYAWVDVWQDDKGRAFFESYVVKRDASGRSAKATAEETICIMELLNKATNECLTYEV